MDAKERNAKIDVISNMMSDMPEDARIGLMQAIFEIISDDSKVDFTDWCNEQMGKVAARKIGRRVVQAGDKIGDVLKDAAYYTEKGARGISKEFSERFRKFTDSEGKYTGEKNPYDENQ